MKLPVLSMEGWNGLAIDKQLPGCYSMCTFTCLGTNRPICRISESKYSQYSLFSHVFRDLAFIHLPSVLTIVLYTPSWEATFRPRSCNLVKIRWADESHHEMLRDVNTRPMATRAGPRIVAFLLPDESWSATAVCKADRSCHVVFSLIVSAPEFALQALLFRCHHVVHQAKEFISTRTKRRHKKILVLYILVM